MGKSGSVSHLWGNCSFLLDPGAYQVLFVPTKSLFPQSYVSSGGSVVGLMARAFPRGPNTPDQDALGNLVCPLQSTREPHVHSFTASQQLHEAAALRYPYLRNKTKAQRGCVCVPRAEGRVRIQASSVFQAPAVPSWSHFAF